MKIFLIGMPGCGKTLAGSLLANIMGIGFLDTDAIIQGKGISITELFSSKGEEAFRKIEAKALIESLNAGDCVIATGGGIIKRHGNVKAMRDNGLVLFIDRPLELLKRDICLDGRPLLQSIDDLTRLYEERRDTYINSSHKVILNNGSINELIKKLSKAVDEYESAGAKRR